MWVELPEDLPDAEALLEKCSNSNAVSTERALCSPIMLAPFRQTHAVAEPATVLHLLNCRCEYHQLSESIVAVSAGQSCRIYPWKQMHCERRTYGAAVCATFPNELRFSHLR